MAGTTYCFYSYKGGVGRSMTLANIAALFFRRPLDVIVVDWDLEAPGIERYFADGYPLDPKQIERRPGLCDLIRDYKCHVSEPPPPGTDVGSPYPDLESHLTTIATNYGCSLRLLTAGDRSSWTTYAGFVQSFDWADFYANWGGGGFFEWLRDELVTRADLVLIDSRTGITEMGGVATHQMADIIVILFAGNEENMASSARMAESFLAGGADDRARPRVKVMLVPSRIDDSDSTEFSKFHARLTDLEGLSEQLPDGYRVRDMLLPYRARLAFEEQLVIGDQELETVLGPLVEGYNRIAANMQQMAPAESRLRLGAGVAHGRVYLLARPHQVEVELEIRHLLGERDFEVLPVSAGTDPSPDEAELASSTCVLVLLDEKTVSSRQMGQVLSHAERLSKPVIPVVLRPDLELPLALASVVTLDWSDVPTSRSARLLRAVRATVPPSSVPSPESFQGPAVARPRLHFTYSREDERLAQRLQGDLRARDIDVGIDVDQLEAGADWRGQLQDALDQSVAVVVLVSPALRHNRATTQEISYASIRGMRIIPVILEGGSVQDLPLELAHLGVLSTAPWFYGSTVDAIADVARQSLPAGPIRGDLPGQPPRMTVVLRGEQNGVGLVRSAMRTTALVREVSSGLDGDPSYAVVVEAREIFVHDAQGERITTGVGADQLGAERTVARLEHLARWHMIRALDNPTPKLAGHVGIELVEEIDADRSLPEAHATDASVQDASIVRARYRRVNNGWEPPQFRILVHNRSDRDLYCTLLDLTDSFECHSRLLPVMPIPAGQTVVAFGGGPVAITLPEHRIAAGRTSVRDWLKVVACEQPFDDDDFALPPLDGGVGAESYVGARGRHAPGGAAWVDADWTTAMVSVVTERLPDFDATSPDVPPYPGQPLEAGAVGRDVFLWQGRMAQRGWALEADGKFGPQSVRVCREFQMREGLQVDGVVGPATWRATWLMP